MFLKKKLKKDIYKALTYIAPVYAYKKFAKRTSAFRLSGVQKENTAEVGSPILGIIAEPRNFHYFYIEACEEMNVPYKVIDLMPSGWMNDVVNSGCAGYLAWPSAASTVWKNMYDEKLKVICDELKKPLFPSYDEMWVWESKRRMHYWFEANNVPHPKGWVFYDYEEAEPFMQKKELPLVFKTNHGDSSTGVKILRTRKQAMKMLEVCFGRGTNMGSHFARDIEWGSIFIQEYIANPTEWRLIRIGESYFGYQKVRRGDFASGSGDAVFVDIPETILNIVRTVTDKHGFKSMSFDILLDENGKLYFIELQSLFGDTKVKRKLMVNGRAGRYKFDYSANCWRFEEGIFDQNNCCNLRVEQLLQMVNNNVELV